VAGVHLGIVTRAWEFVMANPREFLERRVREAVQATPYAVIQAASGNVVRYILDALNCAADQEAEHI